MECRPLSGSKSNLIATGNGVEGQEEMVREQLKFKNLELGDNKIWGIRSQHS